MDKSIYKLKAPKSGELFLIYITEVQPNYIKISFCQCHLSDISKIVGASGQKKHPILEIIKEASDGKTLAQP